VAGPSSPSRGTATVCPVIAVMILLWADRSVIRSIGAAQAAARLNRRRLAVPALRMAGTTSEWCTRSCACHSTCGRVRRAFLLSVPVPASEA
jgi:hypothetical protein